MNAASVMVRSVILVLAQDVTEIIRYHGPRPHEGGASEPNNEHQVGRLNEKGATGERVELAIRQIRLRLPLQRVDYPARQEGHPRSSPLKDGKT